MENKDEILSAKIFADTLSDLHQVFKPHEGKYSLVDLCSMRTRNLL